MPINAGPPAHMARERCDMAAAAAKKAPRPTVELAQLPAGKLAGWLASSLSMALTATFVETARTLRLAAPRRCNSYATKPASQLACQARPAATDEHERVSFANLDWSPRQPAAAVARQALNLKTIIIIIISDDDDDCARRHRPVDSRASQPAGQPAVLAN